MEWWLLLIPVLLVVAGSAWRARKHPSHLLGKEGARLGWVASGIQSDGDGYQNLRLSRMGMKAVISFSKQKVFLVEPQVDEPFASFAEIDRWIGEQMATKSRSSSTYEQAREPIDTNYESDLDAMASDAVQFFRRLNLPGSWGWPLTLHAEMTVYLACYVAKRRSKLSFSSAGWNSFKTSVEHRMVAIRPKPSTPPDATAGDSFVSYTTAYWKALTAREKLAEPPHHEYRNLVNRLGNDLGSAHEQAEQLNAFFERLIEIASRDVIPKVHAVFE